ncbi:MAG: AIR synthase-related protein, partial [Terriglobia bacterium]
HRVLSHLHCADQSAAGSRFDSTVQGRTAIGPYGGKNHRMPNGIYVSAPLYGASYGVITTVAFNPFYGEIDPAAMARLMVIEAVTRAVAAGADYRDLALCDNFYTPRTRPEVAWDLTRMVEAIAELSVDLGIPFISGKDSSSGTFDANGQIIEVPPTLAVAAFGRVPDVKRITTKDFKQAGNKIVLLGATDPDALGGSVYADTLGQRGDSLFSGSDAQPTMALWDALLRLHAAGQCLSAAAIGEGGLFLRLFEAAFGSGLGARVEFDRWRESRRPPASLPPDASRKDGMLFGEFIGAVAVEVPPSFDTAASLGNLPHAIVGEVISDARLELTEAGSVLWQEPVSSLAEVWEKPFREILE